MRSVDAHRQRLTDLNLTYRPQREWIEGRGLLVVVAHFFSGVGAGAWLFSVALDYDAGLVISIAVVAGLAGPAHLAFLGRSQRFWRIALRPHSSWISRGLWGLAIFLAGAIPYAVPPVRDSVFGPVALGVSLAGMAVVLAYKGFVYAVSRAIPFWHLPLLPVLYVAYGLRGGAAVLLVAAAVAGDVFDIDLLEVIKLWVVVSSAVLVLLYLALARSAGRRRPPLGGRAGGGEGVAGLLRRRRVPRSGDPHRPGGDRRDHGYLAGAAGRHRPVVPGGRLLHQVLHRQGRRLPAHRGGACRPRAATAPAAPPRGCKERTAGCPYRAGLPGSTSASSTPSRFAGASGRC